MAEMPLTSKVVLWLALLTAFLHGKAEANFGDVSNRLFKRRASGGDKELIETLENIKSEIESTIATSINSLQLALESRLDRLEATVDEVLQEINLSKGQQQKNTLPLMSIQREVQLTEQSVNKESNTCELPMNLASALNEFNSLIAQTKVQLPGDSVCMKVMDRISSVETVIRETMMTLENQWNNFTQADSVDSRCEEGWHYYEDSCYYFSYNEFRWAEGRQECIRKGGDYAKINSTEEWSHVASQISSHSWVGLNDIDEEGKFKWISDGSDMGEKDDSWWFEGQPDNYQGKEDCVQYWFIDNKVIWNDQDCATKIRIICEKPPMDSE